jgi:cold shock CspA family protein
MGMDPQTPGARPDNKVGGRFFQQAVDDAMRKVAAAEEVRATGASSVKERSGRHNEFVPGSQAHGFHNSIESNATPAQRAKAMAQAEATAERLSGGTHVAAEPSQSEASTKAPPKVGDGLPLGAEGKRYEGRLKTFNQVQGFGFIQSSDIYQMHGCDAFVNQAIDGGIVVGSMVSFTLEVRNGKPQARNCVLEDLSTAQSSPKEHDAPGAVVPGPQAGQLHRGRVKSFNASKGFGFISSRDAQYTQAGQRDIYVSRQQAPEGHLTVGHEVDFQLIISPQGQPQACAIQLVSQAPRPGFPAPGGGRPLFA